MGNCLKEMLNLKQVFREGPRNTFSKRCVRFVNELFPLDPVTEFFRLTFISLLSQLSPQKQTDASKSLFC